MGSAHIECFEQILRSLREPLLLASKDGRILIANVAGAEALSMSVTALEGASLAGFSPAPSALAERLRAPATEWQFPLHARDGRRFMCDARLLASEFLLLRLWGGPDAEPRARVFREELFGLHGITAAVSPSETLDEEARALLARGMSEVNALAAALFLVDQTGHNLELIASRGYPSDAVDRFRLIPLTASLPLVDAVRQAAPVLIGTAEEYASRYSDFSRTHPQSVREAMACIPLEAEGRAIGVLGLGFPLPWTFSEEDRSCLRVFALECASAFNPSKRAADRVPRALKERAALRLECLNAFSGALARAITPPSVVEAVVEMGMAAASARSGGLWLLSADGKTACLARGVGPTGPRAEEYAAVPLDRPVRMPILDAMRDGTPVWIESCRQLEERYPEIFRVFSRGGESSLVCLPLFAQGRCIGGIAFNYEGAHRFLEDERAFLQVLARHSSQAIERARLYAAEKRAREEAEASRRRSDFLARAGLLLATALDYSSTLTAIADAAVPAFADWCIVELEEDRLLGAPPVAAHVDPAKVPIVLELSRRVRQLGYDEEGIPGVIRTGKSRFYPSFTIDEVHERMAHTPELAELYASVGVISSMVVPMSARGRTLGAILLNSARRNYDEHDLETGEELGRRVGLAVDNARLFRDAREADRLKDEFLAMLSHELRNPLAPILTALDIMKLRGDETFARERAIFSRHVGHLVRLVDDLLDVSRVTRGKIQLEKVRCEVSEVIAEAVEMASPLLEARAQHLSLSAPERGATVMADHVRLAQAIANLLINATKYTPAGGTIAIVASVEGSQVIIKVRDSGCGIAPEILPKIFELFVQGKGSLDRAQGGLGIGLTVVKSVIGLHGGSVSAHSDGLDRGSEFVIRLPLASPEDSAPRVAPPPDSRGSADIQLRVLVVDDNQDAADTLSEALRLLGCTVATAHDGRSALAASAESELDLVLLDVGLPDMDGYELARRMRQSTTTASATLVAVTGYGQDADRRRSREAGVSEHVLKPLDLDALLGILERCRDVISAARRGREPRP